MAFLSFSLALGGFTSLAASMQKHHREIFGRTPDRRQATVTRVAGWVLLAASLAAAVTFWPPSIGIAGWTGLLAAAAFIVALGLTYRPRALLPGVAIMLGVGLIGLLPFDRLL